MYWNGKDKIIKQGSFETTLDVLIAQLEIARNIYGGDKGAILVTDSFDIPMLVVKKDIEK